VTAPEACPVHCSNFVDASATAALIELCGWQQEVLQGWFFSFFFFFRRTDRKGAE